MSTDLRNKFIHIALATMPASLTAKKVKLLFLIKLEFNMKARQFLLVPAILLLAACAGKTPDCASKDATNLLAKALANKFQEMGVSATDLEKVIKVSDIQVLNRDEKLDKYKCQANFSIEKPAGLSDKLYKALTEKDGLDNISQKLSEKYGMLNGTSVYSSFVGALSGGLGMDFLKIASDIPAEEKQESFQNMKKLLDEASSPYPIPVTYEVFQVKNDGKNTASLTWSASNDGLFDLSATLYKVSDALK